MLQNEYQLKTPILFMIFNRPETTIRVFERIKEQRPKYLYIVADGPRENIPSDQEMCNRTRDIVKRIDWHCELKTLFREKNLGCQHNIVQAITWFFDNVEEGIILEDDCLPDPTFFRYCEDLLSYYRNDTRVMHISGSNLQLGIKSDTSSYYFSHIPWVWGWATWRRAWRYYDANIYSYRKIVMEKNHQLFHHKELMAHYKPIFNSVYADGSNTGDAQWSRTVWDYQWFYTVNIQHGLSIQPNENLVSNIGFSREALHTRDSDHPYNNIPAHAMEFPLVHPGEMYPDEQADLLMILREVASRSILRWMARSLIKEWLPGFLRDRKLLLLARSINKGYKQ